MKIIFNGKEIGNLEDLKNEFGIFGFDTPHLEFSPYILKICLFIMMMVSILLIWSFHPTLSKKFDKIDLKFILGKLAYDELL